LPDVEDVAVHRTVDPQPRQDRRDDFHVFRPGSLHIDVAAGNGGNDRPASRLDVIAPQRVFRTAQPRSTFDSNRRRARARDTDAKLLQKCAQLDYMRLARGVANLCRAWRAGGGEQRGFRPGDRRLVQVDRGRT
jgi:hypothetical protein